MADHFVPLHPPQQSSHHCHEGPEYWRQTFEDYERVHRNWKRFWLERVPWESDSERELFREKQEHLTELNQELYRWLEASARPETVRITQVTDTCVTIADDTIGDGESAGRVLRLACDERFLTTNVSLICFRKMLIHAYHLPGVEIH